MPGLVGVAGGCAATPFNPETGGDARRNFIHGPGINNWNFTITKMFPIKESVRIEVRADFQNVWNHSSFANPDGNFADGPGAFGVISSLQPEGGQGNRIIQLAGKVYF
jgi:hypothetical protein